MPTPFTGAAATDAVAVPWPMPVSGGTVPAPSDVKLLPAHSGWVRSGIESTRPSFGLVAGSTGGVGVAGFTTAGRHHCCAVSGSAAGAACWRCRTTFGPAERSSPRARSALEKARARSRRMTNAPMLSKPIARAPKRRAIARASAPARALTIHVPASAWTPRRGGVARQLRREAHRPAGGRPRHRIGPRRLATCTAGKHPRWTLSPPSWRWRRAPFRIQSCWSSAVLPTR